MYPSPLHRPHCSNDTSSAGMPGSSRGPMMLPSMPSASIPVPRQSGHTLGNGSSKARANSAADGMR